MGSLLGPLKRASAQTGGQIIFQSGSAINPPFGGGVTALLANGVGPGGQASHIIATGLAVNMNSAGGNVAGKATRGGIITLNSGTTINFAAGGGGNTGLWATGAGSQIVTIGTNLNMPGGGGGDIGVRADTGANVTLIGGAVNVQSNGGGETELMASGAGSSIDAAGLAVNVSNSGGGRGAFLQNGASIADQAVVVGEVGDVGIAGHVPGRAGSERHGAGACGIRENCAGELRGSSGHGHDGRCAGILAGAEQDAVVADDCRIRGRDVRHPALHGEGVGRRADLRTDERERVCYVSGMMQMRPARMSPGNCRHDREARM